MPAQFKPANDPSVNYFQSEDLSEAARQAYVVVAKPDPDSLSLAVSTLVVKEQYRPLGAAFVAQSAAGQVFCQTLMLGKYA